MTSLEKAKKIAEILDEKKAKEVRILHMTDQTVITDYFVIATATSSTHLKALCDEVDFRLRQEDRIQSDRTEGYQGGGWILADYADVIVHLFDASNREFFKLEKLWTGAPEIDWERKED